MLQDGRAGAANMRQHQEGQESVILGLYAAANGLRSMEDRQTIVANNLANVSTPGFRAQRAVVNGFNEMLTERTRHPFLFDQAGAPGGGVKLVETYTNTNSGMVQATGDPLTIALQGPGYIAVDTPQGERFSRNGQFTVDADGQLATTEGYKIQNAGGGGIDAMGASVQIGPDGLVVVDGVQTGQLRLVEFQDPHLLTRLGHDMYGASEEAMNQSAPATETQVMHKAIEGANVSLPYELTQMTLGLRAYGANQRVISAINETLGQLIERVGSPV